MLLTVPTTFSSELLTGLRLLNDQHAAEQRQVYEIYGSFQSGLFNSARPSKYLPAPTREQFARHVAEARDLGIRFNCLLNAPCYANHEYTSHGRKLLHEDLAFLVDAGVASVTVAVPYLVHIIAECFPGLEVVASTIGYIGAMRGIEQYVDAGVDRIVLDVEVNRDFTFLEKAAVQSQVPLEVIANPVCLYQCHYKFNHYCVAGHGSHQELEGSNVGAPYNQFYLNWCFLRKLKNLGEFFKSPWIRPEDTGLWEKVGIRFFKIAGRGMDNAHILDLSRAYLSANFNGNLLNLLGWPHWNAFSENSDGSRLPPLEIFLDNHKLDGFAEYFAGKRSDCRLGCKGCEFCSTWVKRALRVSDPDVLSAYVANMQESLRTMAITLPAPEDDSIALTRWQHHAAMQRIAE